MLDDHEQKRLERIEDKIDRLIASIPPQCARNNERIDSLERGARAVRKSIWGAIGGSVAVVIGAVVNYCIR